MATLNGKTCGFDSGYLTKSPCRGCSLEKDLPGCTATCQKLSQFQMRLAGLIPGTNRFSEYEEYTVLNYNFG